MDNLDVIISNILVRVLSLFEMAGLNGNKPGRKTGNQRRERRSRVDNKTEHSPLGDNSSTTIGNPDKDPSKKPAPFKPRDRRH